ncbi:hypothetical protein DYB31_001357 [Aphanomyces astaci]|uniref:Uncharacterized protein n=1 Tax=Aphanomyces astaci TaxID=112090 RepID=A0A397FYP0_APHAT|nr:hypothetical protein DYB31_001357 [Aphanomyces astaci]
MSRPSSPKPHTLASVSSPTPATTAVANSTDLLDAYKQFHKEKRSRSKEHQRQTILAAKPPPIIASLPPSQDPGLSTARHRLSLKSLSPSVSERIAVTKESQNVMDEYNFTKDEIQAIIKVQSAIRRHLAKKRVLAMAKPAEYVRFVCERLFDECCRTELLPDGMSTHDDGYLVLGGPNLPRILRILEDPTNINLDLLQKHTIDRITVAHAACQRGYLELLSLLVAFWTTQPQANDLADESSHTTLLYKLLEQVNQAKREGKLLRECGFEVIETMKALGLAPDYVFNAIDQFHFKDVTVQDMFKICGHPIVRARDIHGNTPLHYAAEGGYVNVCEFLLEHGAYINEQNIRGETPLHFAISSMHEPADVTIARYRAVELDTGQRLRGVIVTAPGGEEQCQMLAEGAAAKARKPNTDVKPSTPATKRVTPAGKLGARTTRFVQATVGIRAVGQSWHTEGWLSNDDRRKKLVHKMKQQGPPVRKAPRRRKWLFYLHQAILKGWAYLKGHRLRRRYRKTESVRLDSVLKAVGKSTGIVYEYRYESETCSGSSPTFELIIKVRSVMLLVNLLANIQEIYRGGWLLFFSYCTNIWNIFDIVLLSGIWFTTLLDFIVYFRITPISWDQWRASRMIYEEHFRLITYQESTFNVVMYREYDWHTTIMCITAPQMMGDIAVFLFVFVLFLFGFAFAFYVLQLDGFRTLVSSTNSVYQMSLGQWDWGSIAAGGPLAVMLYILYTCFGTIMMLNLLVASQTILTVQHQIEPDKYRRKYWCQTLYALEGDAAIQGIPYQNFDD